MKFRPSLVSFPLGAAVALAIASLAASPAHAQWTQKSVLTASDATYYDYFGYAIAVGGDTAVFGAYLADTPGGTDTGAAYVFTFNGTDWVQKQKLIASDAAPSDHFGYAVAIDGNVIVIGAYHSDTLGTDAGAAYVFRFDGVNWLEESKLLASDGAASDNFGKAVSVKNDVIAIGSPVDDTAAGVDVGSVYAFRYKGAFLLWQEEQKINANDGTNYDYFGSALVMKDHDTILIGAYAHDVTGGFYDAGAVYEFTHGASWTQHQQLTASDAASYDNYGYSLAIEGDRLVVGAYADDAPGYDSGSVYVLGDQGALWVEEDKLLPSNGKDYDYFGSSVAVQGNLILVGSPRHEAVATDCGAGYLFRNTGGHCGWVEQVPEFVGKDRGSYDYLGFATALTSHGALAAAYLKDLPNAYDAGAVYVFDTREFLLTITPTTVSAGQKITFTSAFGVPNDPVLMVVRDINGTPFFSILLISRFTANFDWSFTTTVPTGLSGLNVTFQAYKETDPCRDKSIGTNPVVVHFQ